MSKNTRLAAFGLEAHPMILNRYSFKNQQLKEPSTLKNINSDALTSYLNLFFLEITDRSPVTWRWPSGTTLAPKTKERAIEPCSGRVIYTLEKDI